MKDTKRMEFFVISTFSFFHSSLSRYGFIPNGARVYYERRSQPPFLSLMVESYYQTTNDTDFLR
jgi:alpha,alpha-trehalase